MRSREGHVTEEKGKVPRKNAGEGLMCVCLRLTSDTLKSHDSVSLFLQARRPDASGHTERKAEQEEVGTQPSLLNHNNSQISDSSFTGSPWLPREQENWVQV